jgi:DNA-binding transcriptional regulator/RsmH inhibitor MraZ
MSQQVTGVRKIDPDWVNQPTPTTPTTIMVGMFTSPIDASGRIAIPEPFLKVLWVGSASKTEIGLCPSRFYKCLEGCGVDFAPHMILNNPIRVPIDSAGRIALPTPWMTRVDIRDRVTIIGMGRFFQIWNPHHFDDALADARKRLLVKRH